MRNSCSAILVLAGALAVGSATAPSADTATVATVTSVAGSATAGAESRGLALRSAVADNEAVETEADGKLSLLVASDAAVDMCGDTRLAVEKRGNAEILRVASGELRAFVAPRAADARLEIHTPAAVAVILGTIVHTSVDPLTGDTRFTSRDNPVRVQSAIPGVDGQVTICCGETVSVDKGGKPSAKRKLDARELAALGECFEGLADAAAASDRLAAERSALDRMAEADASTSPLPPVGSADMPDAPVDAAQPGDVCYPPDCGATPQQQEPLRDPGGSPNDPNAPPVDGNPPTDPASTPPTGVVVLPQQPPTDPATGQP